MKNAILMNLKDNVATLLVEAGTNDTVTVITTDQKVILELKTNEAIPYGHKIAIKMIEEGTSVFKFGAVIGKSSSPIVAGDHVHVHNIVSSLF